MRTALKLTVLLIIASLAVTGCGGTKETKPTVSIMYPGSPEWVVKGSGAFDTQGGKVFFAVGSASGIKNMSLLRTAADNRARAEMAKVFQYYSASLMKDYSASTLAGDPNLSSEEQHVEQAIKTVTSITLSGVMIIDHWLDEQSGELFSLARVNLDEFRNNLEKSEELDSRVRDYIRDNAGKLHDELKKEESLR